MSGRQPSANPGYMNISYPGFIAWPEVSTSGCPPFFFVLLAGWRCGPLSNRSLVIFSGYRYFWNSVLSICPVRDTSQSEFSAQSSGDNAAIVQYLGHDEICRTHVKGETAYRGPVIGCHPFGAAPGYFPDCRDISGAVWGEEAVIEEDIDIKFLDFSFNQSAPAGLTSGLTASEVIRLSRLKSGLKKNMLSISRNIL